MHPYPQSVAFSRPEADVSLPQHLISHTGYIWKRLCIREYRDIASGLQSGLLAEADDWRALYEVSKSSKFCSGSYSLLRQCAFLTVTAEPAARGHRGGSGTSQGKVCLPGGEPRGKSSASRCRDTGDASKAGQGARHGRKQQRELDGRAETPEQGEKARKCAITDDNGHPQGRCCTNAIHRQEAPGGAIARRSSSTYKKRRWQSSDLFSCRTWGQHLVSCHTAPPTADEQHIHHQAAYRQRRIKR